MNHQSSIKTIQQLLAGHIAEMHRTTGKDLTVERMRPILACLDNPHHSLRVIHVAGTSGKTSTAYYIADLLMRRGCRIGLTVSPHIDSITERVQIDGRPLFADYFLEQLVAVLERLERVDFQPTYFEVLIALALWCFQREGVAYAVLETGLGGRFDATNIADSPGKVAVITDIGLDHMAILGNTVRDIAWQKAGIIHPGNHVFMYRQTPEIYDTIRRQVQAAGHGAQLHCVEPRPLPGMPLFQGRNWTLAYEVVQFLAERDGLDGLSAAAISSSQALTIPGRLNVFRYQQRTIVVDGAHNEQKMTALIATLRAQYPKQEFAVIAGFKQGKEYESALLKLSTLTSQFVAVPIADNHAVFIRSVPPAEISLFLSKHCSIPTTVGRDLSHALEILSKTPARQPILITGSLYLAAQARAVLG